LRSSWSSTPGEAQSWFSSWRYFNEAGRRGNQILGRGRRLYRDWEMPMNRLYAFMAFAGVAGCAASTERGEFTPAAQERIVPAGSTLELLWNDGEFTEGPARAPDGSIYFSDIGNRILRFDPKSGKTEVYRDRSGKANGLKFDAQGRLIACEGAAGGNRRISITDASGQVRTLADQWNGKQFNSPNDLAID